MIRLLIVDDDQSFADLLARRLLREMNAFTLSLEKAPTAEHAQQVVRFAISPYDIALVDNRLSTGMSGLEFLEWLHQHNPQVDTILFTGLDEPQAGMRAYEAGAFRYLVKPFEPQELVWIVRSLIQKRQAQYERNWLEILNQVGAQLQQAVTLADVGKALVEGGVSLGFERVHLYQVVRDEWDEIFFQGFQQAGIKLIKDFETIQVPYTESKHQRQAYDDKTLKFFHGQEEGQGFLAGKLGIVDSPPALGEWACLPLLRENVCVGTLVMDNPNQQKSLRHEERSLLQLFARQASAAWERALINEDQSREELASKIARRIIDNTSTAGAPGDLRTLLRTLYKAINKITPTTDFVVAMKDVEPEIDQKGWLHCCFHVEDGAERSPYWRPPHTQGLIRYFVDYEQQPLMLPYGTIAYCMEHKLGLPQEKACCWIGVPLLVGEESIGGIFIEEYEVQKKWSQEQFQLCSAVIGQLAHYIQSTWINQQRTKINAQLGFLQEATERLMTLAQQQPENLPEDEWLWHATLTLATASYGFGFNRAMLFTVEAGAAFLRGRVGIGHLTVQEAQRAWEADEAAGLNSFDQYIARLQQEDLELVTPVGQRVAAFSIPIDDTRSAFAEALNTGKVISLSASENIHKLPDAFITAFGAHDYWLVPAKMGNRVIAVMVLDNFCETEPPQTFALQYIETLVNEAALIRENLRKSWVQEQLINLNRTTLPFAGQVPLTATLRKIARVARLVSGADSIAIYPLQLNAVPARFDTLYVTWHEGNGDSAVPNLDATPTPYMQYILDTATTLALPDVGSLHASGLDFSADPVVQQKGIYAFAVAPIRDHYKGAVRGLFYLNYRWRRTFTQDELGQAESFANLVGMALKTWREHTELRQEREMREEELRILLVILQHALQPTVEEADLIETMLRTVRELFEPDNPDVKFSLALFLRAWEPNPNAGEDPIEIRRQYCLSSQRVFGQRAESETRKGFTAQAIREGKPIRVTDVRISPYREVFVPRIPFDDLVFDGANTIAELDVPLLDENGEAIGVFNLEATAIGYFTKAHEAMLQRLSKVAVLALDSVRRRNHLRALLSTGQAITGQIDLPNTLAVVSQEVRKIIPDLSSMTVWYINPGDGKLILGTHTGVRDEQKLKLEYPRPHGAVQAIMERTEPLWAENVYTHPFFANSDFIQREGIVSTAGFPLIVSGKKIGAIFIAYRKPHRFTKSERELLPILAQFVAIGIHDAQSIDLANKEKNKLQAALGVTEAVGATLDMTEIVKSTKQVLQALYPATRSVVLFYNRATHALNIVPDPSDPYIIDNPNYANLRSIPVDENSMLGRLSLKSQQSQKQESLLLRDVQERGDQPYLYLRQSTRATIGITYVSTTGELLGGLFIESDTPNAFDADDVLLMEGMARQMGLAIERYQQSDALDFRNIVTDSMIWAADLAHDLNREIYSIHSWLDILADETSLTEYGKTAIQGVNESFHRIVRDAPWSVQDRATIDNLPQTLQTWSIEHLGEYAPHIPVQLAPEVEAFAFESNKAVLKRIMRHLVRNALKAMNYQGRIRLNACKNSESEIQIQIQDSGPGIPQDSPLRTKLFKQRITESGKGGLGLLFTRLLVERLGGNIHLLDYKEGEGACFNVHLPTKVQPEKEERTQ